MEDFRQNLKMVMAPYKIGAMPKTLNKDGTVKSAEQVKIDALKSVIRDRSNGKVEVDDSVTNEDSLLGILRSYMRLKNYGNGNLTPDNVLVGDSTPSSRSLFGLQGTAEHSAGNQNHPDIIDILGTNLGNAFRPTEKDLSDKRWNSTQSIDSVPTHEFAHTAQFAYDDAPRRYADRLITEADQYEGKYSADDVIKDSLSKMKYVIPKLFDTVFGTHIVPTEEEWGNMTDENAARFWEDNFKSINDGYSYKTVREKKISDAFDKIENAEKQFAESGETTPDLFEKAAKNTGFDSVDEANASISQYAASSWAEAFAEAYSDVLLNGDDARPYSKELIRLYSEAADKWSEKFGRSVPTQLRMLKQLMDVSPLKGTLSMKNKGAK